MKKLTKAILAATLLAVGMPAVAANVDQANGTASDGTYSWEYWNDKKDDGAIWPNWKLVFTPELDATPANVAFNYSLKGKSRRRKNIGHIHHTGNSLHRPHH